MLTSILLSACTSGAAAILSNPSPTIPVATPTNTPEPLAARVNGEGISLADFEASLAQFQAAQAELGLSTSLEEAQAIVLAALIDETLLAQGSKEAGFALSENDITFHHSELSNAIDLTTWQQSMGYDLVGFSLALSRAIRAAWQRQNLMESVPEQTEQVRARQLLYLDRTEAESALAGLKDGSLDFDDLSYSLDPVTGGDLGWFPRGYLLQISVEEAAFGLQPGQFSEVIASDLGYHIVSCLARDSQRTLTVDARQALQRLAVTKWLDEKRQASTIEIMLSGAAAIPTPTSDSQANPTYTATSGDSYNSIAAHFGLTMSALLAANPGTSEGSLAEGASLVIPGRSGFSGELTTLSVASGDSLIALSRQYHISTQRLALLNRLTSPAELYEGSDLVLPVGAQIVFAHRLEPAEEGVSLLEYAAGQNLNPWLIALANQLGTDQTILPDESLVLPGESSSPLPTGILSYSIDPLPLVQGETAVIHVQTAEPLELSGRLDGRDLVFFQEGENAYVAIQGIHVMSEVGLIDFSLGVPGAAPFETLLLLQSGDYIYDSPLTVDPQTIDPAVTEPELDLIESLTAPVTETKYWDGLFNKPVDWNDCSISPFGSRRSYNGSDYTYFHGGLDYGLCANEYIYAPAPGVVVYTGLLTVRGNATIIDHGWGVYSGIWHQSEIYVQVGDQVYTGQVVGKIGDTGRVTGAHLHWELWVHGVQVNPLGWLARSFPE